MQAWSVTVRSDSVWIGNAGKVKMNKKVIKELKRLAKENGGLLQPESVVEAARSNTSPLHSRFQWDNSIAAHEFRLWQARQLIRVTVEVLEATGEKFDVFVSLSPDRQRESGGYRVMVDVLSDKGMRDQLLKDALDDLILFKEKYAKLKELASVFAAIKKTVKARQAKRVRV